MRTVVFTLCPWLFALSLLLSVLGALCGEYFFPVGSINPKFEIQN
jgi:hypothetical protein